MEIIKCILPFDDGDDQQAQGHAHAKANEINKRK
jgi:hypothetical protein